MFLRIPAKIILLRFNRVLVGACHAVTFTITALFCRASVRRTKTADILKTGSCIVRFLSRLFNRPILFGALTGIITAIVLFTLAAPLFALLGIQTLPFGVYITLKCIFSALLGGSVTVLELYAGMIATG